MLQSSVDVEREGRVVLRLLICDQCGLLLELSKQIEAGDYHIRVAERVLHILFVCLLFPLGLIHFAEDELQNGLHSDVDLV